MDTLELIRTQFDYNYALYRRLWDSIAILSDEQFVLDVDYSHGSIRNQMMHVTMVDKRWLLGLQEHPDGPGIQPQPIRLSHPRKRARALGRSLKGSHRLRGRFGRGGPDPNATGHERAGHAPDLVLLA